MPAAAAAAAAGPRGAGAAPGRGGVDAAAVERGIVTLDGSFGPDGSTPHTGSDPPLGPLSSPKGGVPGAGSAHGSSGGRAPRATRRRSLPGGAAVFSTPTEQALAGSTGRAAHADPAGRVSPARSAGIRAQTADPRRLRAAAERAEGGRRGSGAWSPGFDDAGRRIGRESPTGSLTDGVDPRVDRDADPVRPPIGVFGEEGRTQRRRSYMLMAGLPRCQFGGVGDSGSSAPGAADDGAACSRGGGSFSSQPLARRCRSVSGASLSLLAGDAAAAGDAGQQAFADALRSVEEMPLCPPGRGQAEASIRSEGALSGGSSSDFAQTLPAKRGRAAVAKGTGPLPGQGGGVASAPPPPSVDPAHAAPAAGLCVGGDGDLASEGGSSGSSSSESSGPPPQAKAKRFPFGGRGGVPGGGFAGFAAAPPPDDDPDPESEIREAAASERPEVDLGNMSLSTVPARLSDLCGHCVALDLYNNDLVSLPDAVCDLAKLERLSAKSNKLRSLPERLGDLSALTHLYLDQNELRALPASCSQLARLEQVGLDWNDLGAFPDCLCDITGLRTLFLSENPEMQRMPPVQRLAGFQKLELHVDNSPQLVADLAAMQGRIHVQVLFNKVFPDKVLDHIYLGSLRSAQEPRVYRMLNIGYLATIGRELSVVLGEGMESLQLNVDDVPGTDLTPLFDQVHAFIDEAKAAGKACLVHCFKGQSRSATVVISYLMKTRRMGWEEGLAFTRERRPMVNPNPGFIAGLGRYQDTLGITPAAVPGAAASAPQYD